MSAIPIAILNKIPITPAWPEWKDYTLKNVDFGSQSRVVLQSRTPFWKADLPSINLETGESAMYLVYQTADEVPTERSILMGSGKPDVTPAEGARLLYQGLPGQVAHDRTGLRAKLVQGSLGTELRAVSLSAGHLEKVLAPHEGAGRSHPLCRLSRRQRAVGHGRGHALGEPNGPGNPRRVVIRDRVRTRTFANRLVRSARLDRPVGDWLIGTRKKPRLRGVL